MKLLLKAKKAGRKLMRKLGIGKKDKKGKDTRSPKEKEKDLSTAILSAEKIVANENNSDQDIQKGLNNLEKKYDLKALKLVVDNKGVDEDTVHVHGEVNPSKDSKKIKRRKKVKEGTLIHEKNGGLWSEYPLRVTRVVNQHKFFAQAKGQAEKPFDNAALDSSWKKFNPYKKGEAWEAIRNGSEWANYKDARQVLNYRKHARFENPSGKDWHHIIEQNNPHTEHSVVNLGLVDSGINRGSLNSYFDTVYDFTNNETLRDWLKSKDKSEVQKYSKKALFDLRLTIKMKKTFTSFSN